MSVNAWFQQPLVLESCQGVDFFIMKAFTDQRDALRFWALGACAVLLSAASAFTFLSYIGQGIVVGDLLGLSGREADVAAAQRWAIFWLVVSGSCFAGSSVTATLTSPIDPDEPRLPRLVARLVIAATLCFLLTALLGWIEFSVVTASHHSVVH